MTYFLHRVAAQQPGSFRDCPASFVRYWPPVAISAILLPWLLYPVVGDVWKALEFGNLLDGIWPVVVGAALAIAWSRLAYHSLSFPLETLLYERASAGF
jgi:hypothetical protein